MEVAVAAAGPVISLRMRTVSRTLDTQRHLTSIATGALVGAVHVHLMLTREVLTLTNGAH